MKKAVGQMKNGLPGPGQDKDTLTAVQRVSEWHPAKWKIMGDSGVACVGGCVLHETPVNIVITKQYQ